MATEAYENVRGCDHLWQRGMLRDENRVTQHVKTCLRCGAFEVITEDEYNALPANAAPRWPQVNPTVRRNDGE